MTRFLRFGRPRIEVEAPIPVGFRESPLVGKGIHGRLQINPTSNATFNVNHAYGDAAFATKFAEQLAEIDVDEVMLTTQMGTISHEVCMETIRQWGEKIIPRFS